LLRNRRATARSLLKHQAARENMPSKTSHLRLAVLASIAAGLALLNSACVEPLRPEDRPLLEAQGNELVSAIQAFHAKRGRYPASFEEAGIEDQDIATRFGPWAYRPEPDGAGFELTLGDYARDGWTLSWHTKYAQWYWDS
jgi:hypothetical protein